MRVPKPTSVAMPRTNGSSVLGNHLFPGSVNVPLLTGECPLRECIYDVLSLTFIVSVSSLSALRCVRFAYFVHFLN